ncbi:MAG: hypothetical protein ACYCYK_02380 [Candidatus Dormibacteria bacterium]
MWQRPIITIPYLQGQLGTTFAGASNIVRRLVGLGILKETTGFRRNRRFVYADYLRLFGEGPPDSLDTASDDE